MWLTTSLLEPSTRWTLWCSRSTGASSCPVASVWVFYRFLWTQCGGGSKDPRWFVLSWFFFSHSVFQPILSSFNTTYTIIDIDPVQRGQILSKVEIVFLWYFLSCRGGVFQNLLEKKLCKRELRSILASFCLSKVQFLTVLLCWLLFVVRAINFGFFWITP